jgi:hypothetical protein
MITKQPFLATLGQLHYTYALLLKWWQAGLQTLAHHQPLSADDDMKLKCAAVISFFIITDEL